MAQIQLKLEQIYNYKKDLMHHMLDILSRNGSPTGKIGLTVTIIIPWNFQFSIIPFIGTTTPQATTCFLLKIRFAPAHELDTPGQ